MWVIIICATLIFIVQFVIIVLSFGFQFEKTEIQNNILIPVIGVNSELVSTV